MSEQLPGDGGEAAAGGRGRLIAALAVGGLAGLLLLVAFIGKRRVPPYLPNDEQHRPVASIRSAPACLGCHARGTPLDRGRDHTGREDCWNCHQLGP